MARIEISILNDSSLTDEEVAACVPAWQTQISAHFAPAWGVDATLTFVPRNTEPALGTWWLSFLDDSEKAKEAGRHDATQDGLPAGKVFVTAERDNGLKWSVTASHELLEMLADPDVNQTVFIQDSAESGTLYALEVCDAVEDDALGYPIGDVFVSNFMLPSYFRPGLAAGTPPFDFCGKLAKPLPAMLAGGYVAQFTVPVAGGWTQQSAASEGPAHRGLVRIPIPGSRADKRRRPRSEWRHSDRRLKPMPPN